MPLVAAAVCPHPPVIVPEIAAGAADELDDLREACDEAVARLLAAEPHIVCVLGAGPATADHSYPFRASFAGWGVPVEAHLGDPATTGPALPLSVAVGVWLLRRALDAGRVRRPTAWQVATVHPGTPPQECVRFGERLGRSTSLGLLAVGDGSACRHLKAPGYLDPRAESFDATVTKALSDADPAALLALDPVLADELMVAGRAPWQVLAGAVTAPLRGELLYDHAPYGVQYTVASWEPA
ncbi:MAG: hypothetical protein AUI14_08190 [Actinobacteria bacterium 13_2_20CM_2_71_6]|nr:MAG: hypothetical protein AUI14_08190 [Actinobacteria bacterium 13_2_20CM_2_71_6]